MKKKLQKYLSGEREGFSLVELIIVIAIMAILIGIIALAVLPYLERSRVSKDKQTVDTVYGAFQTALAEEKVAQECKGGLTGTLPSATGGATKSLTQTQIEDNLGMTIAEAEGKLVSEEASGGNFKSVYNPTSGEITVYVAGSAGPAKDGDGNPIVSSSVANPSGVTSGSSGGGE